MNNTNAHKFAGAVFGTITGLTAASLLLIPVIYTAALKALADDPSKPASVTAGNPAVNSTPTPQPTPLASSAAITGPGSPDKGLELFTMNCVACHGPDGKGRPGLGKDLVHSQFVGGLKDAELIAFIKRGRDVSDPLNTTKVPMPPKGGNPALQDPQLNDLVAFIRQLQKGA